MPSTPIAAWDSISLDVKALTIKQPWAWLIVNGYKDIENRSWPAPYKGPLLIHAGSNRDNLREIADIQKKQQIQIPKASELEFGGVVGIVDVIDCVTHHPSPWYDGSAFAWVLANPRRLEFRKCAGWLRLFTPQFAAR